MLAHSCGDLLVDVCVKTLFGIAKALHDIAWTHIDRGRPICRRGAILGCSQTRQYLTLDLESREKAPLGSSYLDRDMSRRPSKDQHGNSATRWAVGYCAVRSGTAGYLLQRSQEWDISVWPARWGVLTELLST